MVIVLSPASNNHHPPVNIDRDNSQVLVETHLPTPHGRIYVSWGDGIFSKKIAHPGPPPPSSSTWAGSTSLLGT